MDIKSKISSNNIIKENIKENIISINEKSLIKDNINESHSELKVINECPNIFDIPLYLPKKLITNDIQLDKMNVRSEKIKSNIKEFNYHPPSTQSKNGSQKFLIGQKQIKNKTQDCFKHSAINTKKKESKTQNCFKHSEIISKKKESKKKINENLLNLTNEINKNIGIGIKKNWAGEDYRASFLSNEFRCLFENNMIKDKQFLNNIIFLKLDNLYSNITRNLAKNLIL